MWIMVYPPTLPDTVQRLTGLLPLGIRFVDSIWQQRSLLFQFLVQNLQTKGLNSA